MRSLLLLGSFVTLLLVQPSDALPITRSLTDDEQHKEVGRGDERARRPGAQGYDCQGKGEFHNIFGSGCSGHGPDVEGGIEPIVHPFTTAHPEEDDVEGVVVGNPGLTGHGSDDRHPCAAECPAVCNDACNDKCQGMEDGTGDKAACEACANENGCEACFACKKRQDEGKGPGAGFDGNQAEIPDVAGHFGDSGDNSG